MPFDDVPAFMVKLRNQPSVSGAALEFAILTAARSGEVLGARWNEFDLDAAIWTVPAARMKAGRPHRVPLPPRALQIVKSMHSNAESDFVFPGARAGKPLSNMALEMVLRRLQVEGATVHGFRSSFRDWAGEATNFAREVAEAALAHVIGDKAEQAYRRGDAIAKRRQMMEAWASFVDTSQRGPVVVPMQRSTA